MSEASPRKNSGATAALKALLWIYIGLCLFIAGLNYGYAPKAPETTARFIEWFWHLYENWIKTAFIIIASYLTIKIVRQNKRTRMRQRNLIGFIAAALVIHIFTPLILRNNEVYFFAMPLPWTTIPLQLVFEETAFYASRFPLWGAAGITAALTVYAGISIIVFLGTLLWGRRWQCSTICLFNGFAAEAFAPVFPLCGKRKGDGSKWLKVLSIARWIMLGLGVAFVFYWIMLLSGVVIFANHTLIEKMEIYKYLSAELLLMMALWIVFCGRGYCYYCPLGTVLAFVGRMSGQKIDTNKSKCINCNQCNTVCPMQIDIRSKAEKGEPVISSLCVGCGHCVDSCPTQTLFYTTHFMDILAKRRNQNKN